MDTETMRQILKNEVINQHLAEFEAKEKRKQEEAAKEANNARMDTFFKNKLKNKAPRFGDQY